ncbi:MAG: DUF58 domain-containing protein [Betaproteobacteria bacterium]|nr:DUF58 domain-containing protein [Betaproteobacteria bacterium]
MWRLSYRVFRAVSAVTRWTLRRLTAAGLLVLGVAVAAAAIGIDTTLSLAYQVFGLLAALLLLAALGLAFTRARVAVERALPRLATAGTSFTYRVRVTNLTGASLDGLALIEEFADPIPGFAAFRAGLRFPAYRGWKRLIESDRTVSVPLHAVPPLAPHATADVVVQAHALRRGVAHSTGVTVARCEPLGLARVLARMAQPANLTVLPRRYAVPALDLPGSRRYQQGGVTLATSVGESEEFIGLRDYRPGDPLQRMHWKSFARAGHPVVKEYQDEFFVRHALVLDTFAGPHAGRAFEEAVSIAASFACTIDTHECLLDLMFIGTEAYCYTVGRGQLPLGGLLEILACVQPCRERGFRALHDAVLARRSELSGCILILLGWDEARHALVDALRGSGVPLRAMLVAEQEPPARPEWLAVVAPGSVEQGLARL